MGNRPTSSTHRADALLVRLGLAPTRSTARQWILDGRVAEPKGKLLENPAQRLPADTPLQIVGGRPFVSRAGDKLEAFLQAHPVELVGEHCLDLGAATGGFTECLLRRGARHVTCLDVGHGQLHARLAGDARITNLEGLNARSLATADLPYDDYGIIVADLSFISLQQVLPAAWARLRPGGCLIVLIKPQFEVGPELARHHRGVIRDTALQEGVVETLKTFAQEQLIGSQAIGTLPSPIRGGDGNQEYLSGWRKASIRGHMPDC